MSRFFDREVLRTVAARHDGAMRLGSAKRLQLAGVCVCACALLVFGLSHAEVTPSRIWTGLGRLGDFAVLMFPPDAGSSLHTYVSALGETLAIALLGTLLAACTAAPLSILASRNVLPVWLIRVLMRRGFDTIRGIDTLIWALIWIGVVGLGPFAGVLAIATSDFGAFGKLFSETIETADRKPVEGIRSVGGTSLQELRFGIIPQVLPIIAGQVLYYFESNTRSATIIGIVGAGGIGLHLSEQIRTLEWQRVSFIIAMVLVTVALIDVISSKLRAAITGARPL